MQIKVLQFNARTKEMIKTFGHGKRIKGLYALAQHFLIILFTSSGTDYFYPNLGGNMKRLSTGNYDEKNIVRLMRNVAVAVMRTKEQVLESQVNIDIPDDEKLADAILMDSKIKEGKLFIRIYLKSQSNESAVFAVGG